MDGILEALRQSLNPDASVRREAESYLGQASSQNGFLVNLLQLIVRPDVASHVQLSAAVQLKNGIRLNWDTTKSEMKEYRKLEAKHYAGNMRKFLISENDKPVIRDNMVEAMARAQQPSLRKTLGACVRFIAKDDFPLKWSSVVNQSLDLVRSQSPSHMHAGLLIVDKLFKKYEYISRDCKKKKNNDVDHMYALVNASFPLIRSLGEALLGSWVQEAYAPELLKLCCKIFYKGFRRLVTPYLNQPAELQGWAKLFVGIMQVPNDSDEWWSAKRRATMIMDHFIRNNSRVLKDERSPEFVDMVAGESGIMKVLFLPCTLDLLRCTYVQGHMCTNIVKMLAFNIIQSSVDHATLFQLIKANLQFLVEDVYVPAASWTRESMEEWQADPEQFIQEVYSFGRFNEVKGMSLTDDAAQSFETLCRFRKRYVMPIVMQVMDSVIRQYQANPTNLEVAFRKSGLLRLIQELHFLFKSDPEFQIEAMICQHVLPDTRSPFPFLRYSSCQAIADFLDIQWGSVVQETMVAQTLIGLLNDPEIPVQVEAAVSLDRMFKCATPAMDAVVIQVIPHLVDSFHRLSQSVGIDSVFGSMQTLIEKYPSHVRPFATQICVSLTSAFYKITILDDREEDDEELDAAAAAGDCLNSLDSLLASFAVSISEENRQILISTVPHLTPLFNLIFVGGVVTEADAGSDAHGVAMEIYGNQIPCSKNVELMDNCEMALSMIHKIVYHTRMVPPVFWKYIVLFDALLQKSGDEYVTEILNVVESMIHFDPTGFMQPVYGNKENFEYIFKMIKSTGQAYISDASEQADGDDEDDDEDFNEDDEDDHFYHEGERKDQSMVYSSLVLSTMFQACSSLERYMPPSLDLIIRACQAPVAEPWVMTNFLNAIQSAIYHNTQVAINIIGPSYLPNFVQGCLDYLESHTVLSERLILLLCFIKLIVIQGEALPCIAAKKPEMIVAIATLFTSITQMRAAAAEAKVIRHNKALADEGKPMVNHDDDLHRSMFRRQGPTDCPEHMNTFDYNDQSYVETNWEDELEEDDGEDGEDEDDYESPVDTLNEFSFFVQTFSQAGPESQQEFRSIMATMPVEIQNVLQQVIAKGSVNS